MGIIGSRLTVAGARVRAALTPAPPEDPRTEITNHAFSIAPQLLGVAIAPPWRRGLAMLLDVTLIGLLATGKWFIWLPIVCWGLMVHYGGRPARIGIAIAKFTGYTLAFILALVITVFVMGDRIQIVSDGVDENPLLDLMINNDLEQIDQKLGNMSDQEIQAMLTASGVPVTTTEGDIVVLEEESAGGSALAAAEPLPAEPDSGFSLKDLSIVDLALRFLSDLGIEFGIGALYFTLFTWAWQGQTPGKRLLGTRAVKLDGSSFGIWDAFGRYGGYATGIATGLLGFLQIFWDPNRQAMQDKLAFTAVIRNQ
ncbi:RDD family protein [Biformimicrobium ophioploci]|uniref:RDD domain-containing protein n=1 Tax=Biformimicrobium ophioploci TaxID=3036711 RepID=A0ABQ6LWN9_9GAMM|nr:RDD family protein [Microbulbifer sp. NKW57]GMG86505.1 hypothetical protein MNKW57_08260 [Microbulbifer sp. NKW57]